MCHAGGTVPGHPFGKVRPGAGRDPKRFEHRAARFFPPPASVLWGSPRRPFGLRAYSPPDSGGPICGPICIGPSDSRNRRGEAVVRQS